MSKVLAFPARSQELILHHVLLDCSIYFTPTNITVAFLSR